MQASFSRNLSLLRMEKGASQRQVAAELGISQALLSHYENGIREPGFAFLDKVCGYYQVSADFLLGRTSSRDGRRFALTDPSEEERARLEKNDSDVAAMAHRDYRVLDNAMAIVFDLLAQVENPQAIQSAYNYLGSAVYRMFRHISNLSADGKEALFSVPDLDFALGASRADMILDELAYMGALKRSQAKGKIPRTGYQALSQAYPEMYDCLMQVVYRGGERVSRVISAHHEASTAELTQDMEDIVR